MKKHGAKGTKKRPEEKIILRLSTKDTKQIMPVKKKPPVLGV